MKFVDVIDRIHARAEAVSGGALDIEGGRPLARVGGESSTEDLARGLLSGLIEGEQLDDLLAGLHLATVMASKALTFAAMTGNESLFSTLYLNQVQMVATGLLLNSDEPAQAEAA